MTAPPRASVSASHGSISLFPRLSGRESASSPGKPSNALPAERGKHLRRLSDRHRDGEQLYAAVANAGSDWNTPTAPASSHQTAPMRRHHRSTLASVTRLLAPPPATSGSLSFAGRAPRSSSPRERRLRHVPGKPHVRNAPAHHSTIACERRQSRRQIACGNTRGPGRTSAQLKPVFSICCKHRSQPFPGTKLTISQRIISAQFVL